MNKKEILELAQSYYNSDVFLEEEKLIGSAESWLDGYLYAYKEMNILTIDESSIIRNKIISSKEKRK